MRQLKRRNTFAWEDIQRLIRENDLSSINTFLVLNGGTGVGKTSSIMQNVQNELEIKLGRPQSMLVVESRTATVEQLRIGYSDKIETFGGIDVCQRLGFLHILDKKAKQYDWVVIDECHGLFSEASFAADAQVIANWIKTQRTRTHIIFVTANDEYFEDLSRKYFPEHFTFIYLFPDFTHYVSNTYVKEIQFIKTNKVDDVITALLDKLQNKKGILFFKKASAVKNWFFKMLGAGMHVGMVVSQANETEAALTTYQQKQAKDAAIDISDGQTGLTMADLCELFDTMRRQQGKEGIREAIYHEHLPDDVDVLLATDTIQEGISIKSHIDYIIIEGFTEVEVRQKLGRFRGNLDLLYIIFNPQSARAQILDKCQTFTTIMQLYEEGNQTALAEFYGRQETSKSRISFLIKKVDSDTGKVWYEPNTPALLNCQREWEQYNKLMGNTEQAVIEMYSYPLLKGTPQILNYQDDIRNFNMREQVRELAERWRGIPLKGRAQEEFIGEFVEEGITDEKRQPINTFVRACNMVKKCGYSISEKRANKQDLIEWSDFLTTSREKYKVID